MRIQTFQFRDLSTGWHLEETKLNGFNLLIGISGVGKTKILRSLDCLRRATQSRAPGLPGNVEWEIRFEHEGYHYRWHAVFVEPAPAGMADEHTTYLTRMRGGHGTEAFFDVEELDRDGDELVRRAAGRIRFQGNDLPKLNRSESALSLLSGEPTIAMVLSALDKRRWMTDRVLGSSTVFAGTHGISGNVFEGLRAGSMSFEAIRDSPWDDIVIKAYLLQEATPERWQEVKDTFRSIFPSVKDLRIVRFNRTGVEGSATLLMLLLREDGATDWIHGSDVSAGMHRCLSAIVGLHLAPPGSVILIDEIENGLGKNCMPQLVDLIVARATDLQFIITSHHPYIINNIPISTWRLVQRRGSQVRVIDARDIASLQRTSHHEAFDRLLNLPEFEEGIA